MQYKTLDSLCKVASGGTPSRSKKEYWDGGDIPWIKIGNIKSKVVSNADEYITEAGLNNSSAKLFKKGTILYTIFATLGEVGILDFDACTNQAIAGISIEKPEEITTDYLYYYLKSKKAEVNQIGRGVAQNNINLSILRKFSIPLRDIEDQKTIVGSLNKVESIIEKQKQQLERLDELIKARFVEMFGGSKTYPIKPLSDIAEYWNGLTYKPTDVSNDGTIVLRSSNIQNMQLDLNDIVRVKCEISNKKMVKKNDILMCSRNGSAKLVGKVALIPNLQEQMSFGAFMMIIRSEYYSYLMTYFQLPEFRSQISTGTTTINQITRYMLDKVKLPVPDKASIDEFAAFVAQVDKSKFAIQKSLEKTQLLFDSLMQEYFG
ncbi:restriction endonuclease subunit S [Candidatus Saccharibacteria bacterium]|nr:restriction endonuclease subunit S [Candidatus Saccharibacteria bacterium]